VDKLTENGQAALLGPLDCHADGVLHAKAHPEEFRSNYFHI
jgi:hypothetical protein